MLSGLDLHRFRPWVLVIEATAPNTSDATHEEWEAEVLAAGYQLCLFDGVSRFYAAAEHAGPEAEPVLPACVLDDYEPRVVRKLREDHLQLQEDLLTWRNAALAGWARDASAPTGSSTTIDDVERLQAEIDSIRASTSWRLTSPLRRLRAPAARRPEAGR